MSTIYYRQCLIAKGTRHRTTWLPEKFAKQGKLLKIKLDDGWDDGWVVVLAFETRMVESEVSERSQDYKRTRKASDI